MKIIYQIPGTLVEGLHVVNELAAVTGMNPEEIITEDQRKVRFNKTDYHALEKGNIDPEKYIIKNLIS